MSAIDVWAQITTERMLKRPWMQTLLRCECAPARCDVVDQQRAGVNEHRRQPTPPLRRRCP